MKRFIKLGVAVILAVSVLITLCSCNKLDEMRESQAVWTDTGYELTYKGNSYHLLPSCGDLYFYSDSYGYVTDSDVPVLLSHNFGIGICVDRDETLIVCGHWPDGYNKLYCIEDEYDKTVTDISNYSLDHYCMFSPEYDEDGNTVFFYKLLDDRTTSVINEIIKSVPSENGSNEDSGTHNDDSEYYESHDVTFLSADTENVPYTESEYYEKSYQVAHIYKCDSTLKFIREPYNIIVSEKYVGGYFLELRSEDEQQIYQVPEEYNPVFDRIKEML